MKKFDLVISGGEIADGSGAPRRAADVGIANGKIAAIGKIAPESAARVLDARGLIVAPGVIDLHTHYDVQIHWDPYCTSSGWHGTTTVAAGNCGFGFAPCRPTPEARERYMRMMENTEEVSYGVMKKVMKWDWETFPEWLAALKRLPKAVNFASYLPMNALLSYVIGADEAKKRPATEAERAYMRKLMKEALDAGAAGFSFCRMGFENGHVDHDYSPMPCEYMAEEEAYNLATVLRQENKGVIQAIVEASGMDEALIRERRQILETLARISGRPVIHNITMPTDGMPEVHRNILAWLDEVEKKGLRIYSQALTSRTWTEMNPTFFNGWVGIPLFHDFTKADFEGKMRMVQDPAYRQRMRAEYRAEVMGQTGGSLETYTLLDACGSPTYSRYEGRLLEDIVRERGENITDFFLDLLTETKLGATFRTRLSSINAEYVAETLRHPKVIPGISDGGAHNKMFSNGHYSTDMIRWLVRETGTFSLEEIHQTLSQRAADAFGLEGRGLIHEGYSADIMVYDYDRIGFDLDRYTTVHDLPDGGFRRTVRAEGIAWVLVNGEVTVDHGECTGNLPGMLVTNAGAGLNATG
jgi:N-acyl-D-aspartate/D-glutamate deacylase